MRIRADPDPQHCTKHGILTLLSHFKLNLKISLVLYSFLLDLDLYPFRFCVGLDLYQRLPWIWIRIKMIRIRQTAAVYYGR